MFMDIHICIVAQMWFLVTLQLLFAKLRPDCCHSEMHSSFLAAAIDLEAEPEVARWRWRAQVEKNVDGIPLESKICHGSKTLSNPFVLIDLDKNLACSQHLEVQIMLRSERRRVNHSQAGNCL